MALKVKTIKKNKKVDAYLRITNINFVRGMPNMGSNLPNLSKFGLQISYDIFEENKMDIPISRGQFVAAYDLSKVGNVYEYAYKELEKIAEYKNALKI